ncbi:histidine kinase [Arthrobacter sp. MYb23]|uniref:sensor histidine kinase n=1 Tax=unclassified Arthrobacter TaxID=235627 RepID=UPI000CFD96FB|nr:MULTISPECIES: sensor histidine kinase [unclassified Arthrobacter]PRB39493.1 histidine kinase [Arthrobacter sp. MYb51]PRB98069.1 histidine kinase [Arthrobacter sp. MYb23]
MFHSWSIARRLFVANLFFVLVLTAVFGAFSVVEARDRGYDEAGGRMLAIAASLADNPLVLEAASTSDPSAVLQPYALEVMDHADADFITIMAPDRTRWTHPRTEELGKPYIGTIEPALRGETFTEVTAGTLGPSVRTIAPVLDPEGNVKALVAAGVTVRTVDTDVAERLGVIGIIALVVLFFGSVASWLLGRYLRSVTRGWGPEQLAQLFAYYESVLHSVREGVILIDTHGKAVMYNDQAAELLGLAPSDADRSPDAAPKLADLPFDGSLRALFESGRPAHDESHLTGSRILVVNQAPAVGPVPERSRQKPAIYGTVATIRDRTEIESLGTELQTMKTLSDALRAQTHEHANRLHMIVSLLELGRTPQALDFATKDLELSQQLTDDMVASVDEPVMSALVMGKAAEAHERGVELVVRTSGSAGVRGLEIQDLVTILGNLLDNAIDAAAAGEFPRKVELEVDAEAAAVEFTVRDSGGGIDPGSIDDVLQYGFSTKSPAGSPRGSHGRGVGLALVRQAVERLNGTMTISNPGGAQFHVVLPAPAPEEEKA